ncbi:triple tyrosine motif-containing protein [Sphingobacterium sp. LRF_L2]|uniref:helix-turn-helix and ligand-binding sensor domain-containing protein n=1 Tax=Sphingobacterium sp. LRF_L2 TaxID=3369421 RepID=UPI003F647234
MTRIFILFAIIVLHQSIFAQRISSIGNPYVQNYTKSQYKAGNQNWSITQGKDGVIYAANNNGLMTYDGAYWDLHPLSNRNFVRSVAIAPNGDIYIGGKEEFGYFTKENGTLKYHKLSQLVDSKILENDEIWKILFIGKTVIFQSFSKFYSYENGKIQVNYGQGEPLLFAHQIKDRIWIEKIPSGLQQWTSKGFTPLANQLSNVLTILPFESNQHLVGTAKNGLYLLSDDGIAMPWKPDLAVTKLLKEAQLNNGLKVNDDVFAFGTIKNGIFIIDKDGHLLQHIHKRNGLQNNTVLSLTLDKQGNIWAGLDNGIDRIEINSPFYYFNDIFGELGTVYAIQVFDNKIYLGTNQGLFYSNWSEGNDQQSLHMQFVPGSQGQVWSLDIFDNQLLCGHNDGTYLVKGTSVTKISNWTGGWANIQIKSSPQLFLQGNYTGLATFQNEGAWKFRQKLDQPKAAVIKVSQKDNDTFWVVLNNAIQLATFTDDYKKIQLKNTFLFSKDFPNIQRINPSSVEGNAIFTTDKGIFIYDNVLSIFKPYEELNKALGSYAKSSRVKPLGDNAYIFAHEGHFAKVTFRQNQLQIDSSTFNILQDIVMKNYEVVQHVGRKLLFGLDNGIAIYDSNFNQNEKLTPPLIKGFQDISAAQDSLRYINLLSGIPNRQNSIRILFSSPWFTKSPLKYQYILEGYQSDWSLPLETPYIDFTNLGWGNYTFKVRAITATGEISETTEIRFHILAPWYLQWHALIIYLIAGFFSFFVARKLIIDKITKDKLHIQKKLQRRQEEILRRETEQNEKKLVELKNEQLEQELELKNRELANAATNIVYKNELLNNLHEELLNVKDRDGKKLSNDQLQKVNKLIDNARSDERDWDLFEKSFNESHENFFKKLKTEYPSLSPNDLKLCAYLRLNMSSKDIASLLNISTRGVEIRRYRLRKKFNLPTEKNLSEFLLEL